MICEGIEYCPPKVILMNETGLGVSEYAARTCYDSFEKSENTAIKNFSKIPDENKEDYKILLKEVNNIESSELLNDLSWTYFHHSILEHTTLNFLIKGTSRGVLQEHARHRIQAISVRSTRYTMGNLINIFIAERFIEKSNTTPSDFFINKVNSLNLFVTSDINYNNLQIKDIFQKLLYQTQKIGNERFLEIAVSKSSLKKLRETQVTSSLEVLELLEKGKSKRNVGDSFKHIVNDNWKVDMVVSFNLRSLKNYFNLRNSGAAYFQIKELAKQMINQTPNKYLDLIIKINKLN